MDQRSIDVASSSEDDIDANIMDQKLIDVAKTGDVDAFYALLGEDQSILERIASAPFVDTPLHIAIVDGNTAFAVEIANLKPSFARKLSKAGLSPIHLASAHGNLKIVLKLLSTDHDLCLLAGRGNRIPLHFAAEAGRVDVMKALLKDCPDSIGMLTVREETPLHLAARNGKVEACKVLLESIVELNRTELMNWKDENRQTARDVAAGSREVVALLENENHTLLERRALHAEKKRRAKAGMEIPITSDSRSATLVVLALIITATFQVVVNPPGGVWQDTVAATGSQSAHEAGKAVMGTKYISFGRLNTTGFCASIVSTTLLTNDIPFKFQTLMMVCMAVLIHIFDVSIKVINPAQDHTNFFSNVFSYSSISLTLTTLFIFFSFIRRLYRRTILFYY